MRYPVYFRLTLTALAVVATLPVQAQQAAQDSRGSDAVMRPWGGTDRASAIAPQAVTTANASVGSLRLVPSATEIVADGQAQVAIKLQILDEQGAPLQQEAKVTIEVIHGLLNLQPGKPLGLVQDGSGRMVSAAEAADIDPLTPGIQIKVRDSMTFSVVAPFELKDVQVRVTAGRAQETVTIKALPELRDMLAVGVIEGQLRLNHLAKNLVPANEGDLFERELKRYAVEFSDGRGSAAARAAFFLKGKVKGEYLLTVAMDSEKLGRSPLFRDIDPNAFYPVYGDSSIRGADAQSSGRLYVRIDKDRSYLLYGDYNTSTPSPLLSLGNYARTANGLKWHFEDLGNTVTANAFASYDNLSQITDEIPGRGISGPYSVSNPNGVAGTERVEVIVRDRNPPHLVLRSTAQARQSDYEFEPFSGKILFKAPVPSADENLNPISIRISYEVEQGGAKFWMIGASTEAQVSQGLRVGATIASDNNPNQGYTLGAVGLKLDLGQAVKITAELARSDGTPGGVLGEKSGNAARVMVDAQTASLGAQLKWQRADVGFDNPAAALLGGRQEWVATANYKLGSATTFRGEVSLSDDSVLTTSRKAASVSIAHKPSQPWTVEVGLKQAKDTTSTAPAASSAGSSTGICSGYSGYNGGFGVASSNGVTDSLCNNGSRFPVAPASLAAASPNIDTGSIFTRVTYSPPEPDVEGKPVPSRWSIFGEAEVDVHDSDKRRIGAGVSYQLAERSRLYIRYESINSVTGLNGLTTDANTHALVAGVSSDYAENAQVYNEYRQSAASSGRISENSFGLRNTFGIAPGLKLSTNAELIKVLSGTASDAVALGVGLDYSGSDKWKSSGRVEWRRDNSAQNWVSTAKLARKVDETWTLLGQNYLSMTVNRAGDGRKLEDRFLVGAAYRPIDTNQMNILMRYELRHEQDSLPGATQPKRQVHIASVHGDWHPQRVWHANARVAMKQVKEQIVAGINTVDDQFAAWLAGARVMYDLTDRWSAGGMVSTLAQTKPATALQFGYGLEVGYAVTSNLWLNTGYTWRGLNDKDLVASEYRNRGVFMGLRWKFDENVFGSNNPRVNKSMEP
jgi:hypothetical protein